MKKTEQDRIEEIINRHLRASSSHYKPMDEMEWLQYKRRQTKKKLDASKRKMILTYQTLTSEAPPTSKWGMFSYMIDRSMNIIQGVRMGYKIGDAIRMILKMRKSRKN